MSLRSDVEIAARAAAKACSPLPRSRNNRFRLCAGDKRSITIIDATHHSRNVISPPVVQAGGGRTSSACWFRSIIESRWVTFARADGPSAPFAISASWTNKLVIERADVDLLFRPDVNSIANHARTDFTFELLARDEILLSVLEHHSNLGALANARQANGDFRGSAHHPDSVCSMQDLANPSSASVHSKRFSTPSLTLKILCTGNLNPRGAPLQALCDDLDVPYPINYA